jgi:hypothetical protein
MNITPEIKKRWRLASIWIRHHKKRSIIIGCVLLALVAGGVSLAVFYQSPVHNVGEIPLTKPQANKPKPAAKFYSPLTGEKVADKATTQKPVTAIMIENSPDARPQSGLADAEVVYEAIAEGGITRFLALYQNHNPSLVGPVRSVRMYYVDWLKPYDASVAHVGGSYFALQEVRNGSYRDIDQFFNPGAYWRASDRYAPHNVYTNFEKLNALNASKGYKTSSPAGIPRGDTKPAKKPNATSIAVHISGPTYDSSYSYDAATNTYLRSQAGAPHNDREKGQIRTRVIAVIKTDMNAVMQDGIREDYRTTGTGEAYIFQDGTVHKATWHKQDRSHQMFFTGENGKELPLARGTTWITALNADGGVTWQ